MTSLVMSNAAQSTPILTVVDGQLISASGVEVDGQTLDVEFDNGTCVEVFSGCD